MNTNLKPFIETIDKKLEECNEFFNKIELSTLKITQYTTQFKNLIEKYKNFLQAQQEFEEYFEQFQPPESSESSEPSELSEPLEPSSVNITPQVLTTAQEQYPDANTFTFIIACSNNDIEKVKVLLKHPNVEPILEPACEYEHYEIVKLLLEDDRCDPSLNDFYCYHIVSTQEIKDLLKQHPKIKKWLEENPYCE